MPTKDIKNAINNYDVYVSRMKNTYYDKCWWINHIPENIDKIIDFGCADAGIFKFIDDMYPERFTYIGIDENEEMLKIAREKYAGNNRVSFYTSFDEITNWMSSMNTILILNSVMHELFSYKSHTELIDFIEDIRKLQPTYIAIRDMHINKIIEPSAVAVFANDFSVLMPKKFVEPFTDFKAMTDFSEEDFNFYLEFLLKYFYTENWTREVKERYLWDWSSFFKNTLCKNTKYFSDCLGDYRPNYRYSVEYEENFSIRFLQDKWMKDFGMGRLDTHTHKKMLLKRN